MGVKVTDTRTQSKAHGVSIDNRGPSFLTSQEIRVRSESVFSKWQRGEDECHTVVSNLGVDFYEIRIQKFVPRYYMSQFLRWICCKIISTLAVSITISLSIKLGFVSLNDPREIYFVDYLRKFPCNTTTYLNIGTFFITPFLIWLDKRDIVCLLLCFTLSKCPPIRNGVTSGQVFSLRTDFVGETRLRPLRGFCSKKWKCYKL